MPGADAAGRNLAILADCPRAKAAWLTWESGLDGMSNGICKDRRCRLTEEKKKSDRGRSSYALTGRYRSTPCPVPFWASLSAFLTCSTLRWFIRTFSFLSHSSLAQKLTVVRLTVASLMPASWIDDQSLPRGLAFPRSPRGWGIAPHIGLSVVKVHHFAGRPPAYAASLDRTGRTL